MIKEIKNTIKFAAIAAPIYAAADTVNLAPAGQFSDLSKVTVTKMIASSIQIIFIVAALIFFFILVIGGIKWITSGGDEKKVAAARSGVTNALIGLVIVFAAWAILTLIGNIFGVNILQNFAIPTFTGA